MLDDVERRLMQTEIIHMTAVVSGDTQRLDTPDIAARHADVLRNSDSQQIHT